MRHPARSRPANNTSSESPPPNRPVVRARSLTFFSLPRYDGTILAYGCDGDRTLDVPGEALSGVLSAREFVGWFNGDPRCVAEKDAIVASALANPRGDTAVIFGLGNVAVDCARILLRDPNHLAETDVCDHALRALRSSAIRRVALVGRRGVAQAAFSPKELRELLNLPNVRVTVDEADMATEAEDEADLEASRPRRRARDALAKAKEEKSVADDGTAKELVVKFLRSRRAFHPMDATDARDRERVGSVTLALNRLEGFAGRRRATATGETETLAGVSLALRSVGYRATPVEHRGVRPLRRTPRGGGEHARAGRDAPRGRDRHDWNRDRHDWNRDPGVRVGSVRVRVAQTRADGGSGGTLTRARGRWHPWWRTTPRARSRDPRANSGDSAWRHCCAREAWMWWTRRVGGG